MNSKIILTFIPIMLLIAVLPVSADSGSGDAQVNNVAPSVSIPVVSTSTVDPEAYFTVTVTVRDNNTLGHIDNVILEVFDNGDTYDDPNRKDAHYTFWFDPSDNSWHSDPSTNTQGNAFIDSSGSAYPDNLLVAENDYRFSILLNGTANNLNWDVWAKAVDENSTQDNAENSNAFSVNNYINYNLVESSIEWTGLSVPSSDNPSDNNPITVNQIETNVAFDVQNSLSGDWSDGGGGTIPAENTTFENNSVGGNSGSMSASSSNVYTNQTSSEALSREINYYLDVPVGTPSGTYTTTFTVGVVQN